MSGGSTPANNRCRSLGLLQSSARPGGATSSPAAPANSLAAPSPRRIGSARLGHPNAGRGRRRPGAWRSIGRAGRVPPCSTRRSRCMRHPRRVWPARPGANGSLDGAWRPDFAPQPRLRQRKTMGHKAASSRLCATRQVLESRLRLIGPSRPLAAYVTQDSSKAGRDPHARCSRGRGRLSNPSKPWKPGRKVSER